MRLHLLGPSRAPHVEAVLGRVVRELGDRGLRASWSAEPPPGRWIAGDAIIVHAPLEKAPPQRVAVLGLRLLDRQQRLVLVERAGLPVARWARAANATELAALFDRWKTDTIVYKADVSLRRRGVRPLRPGDGWPTGAEADGDVFMEVLREDPVTYKLDVFYDVVLGAYAYETPPIGDPRFHDDVLPSRPFTPSRRLAEHAAAIGKALSHYGAGYVSIDWMRRGRGFAVIEVNTASVGVAGTWKRAPDVYARRYARGIRRWIADGGPACGWRRACDRVREAFSSPGGYGATK